ncbi:MAG: DUF362 domain-containing protein [Chloroflexota bacterium]
MTSRYPVAIVHEPQWTAGQERVDAAVRRGLDLLGGIERYVRPRARVLLKVNMFTRATPESGKVTHPAVVLAVARLCHACGAQVQVIERLPHYDYIFRGYEAIHQVAELVPMESLEHRHRYLPGAKSLLPQLPWANLLDECDVFINLPGLRTHALTKLSNGMKNLMGVLPSDATRLVHHYGLDGSICDLNSYRPSDLVITEALYALEGNFPSEGTPVKTDLITVADNVVAADLVAARIAGQDAGELFYLQEAIARGMGPASLAEVDLLGDDLHALTQRVRIAPAPRAPEPHAGPFRLFLGNMCAPCRQALAGGLLAASHQPDIANLRGVSIVAGHHDTAPDVGADRVLLYGNCAYPHRRLGHYEPGCPPLAGQVARGLRELKPRTIQPSMCSIAWCEAPIEHVAPRVAEAGYVGLEAWGPHLDRYAQEHGEIEPLARLLADLHLSVPMISAYFDLEKDLEGSLETARRYAGYARQLGAPLIRVFTRGGESATAGTGAWRAVVAGLRQMCDLDPALGFALETHGGHLHDTAAATLRLLRQTERGNLCVALDIFNLHAIGEEPVAALQRLLPWVRIVHLKNGVREGERWRNGLPLAQGAMDYRPFLQALLDVNYGGYCSVEWFGPEPDAAAVSELAFLRGVLGERLGAR